MKTRKWISGLTALTLLASLLVYAGCKKHVIDTTDEPAEIALAPANKVLVCHNGKTISVNENALQAHLAHGDIEGICQDEILEMLEDEQANLGQDLDIIARSVANLVTDQQLINAVANEILATQIYRVSFARLIEISSANGVDLKAQLETSLIATGAPQIDIDRFNEIIEGFSVGKHIEFTPAIVYPQMDIQGGFRVGSSGFDGKTPCYTVVSLFNVDGTTVPVYRPQPDGTVLVEQLPKGETFVRPAGNISLIPNFETGKGKLINGERIVEIDQDGQPTGKQCDISNSFKQHITCECVQYHVGSPEGDVVFLCEGSGVTNCSSDPNGCEGLCRLAVFENIFDLEACN